MSSATTNACKLCSPLGASMVFRGIDGAMPILHGSQGCSTYIRRYIISHFREPIDVASSNFSESSAVFGGRENLHRALDNVIRQYHPTLVGIATTCLSETIGDDVPGILRDYRKAHPEAPPLVHVATPSYSGSHIDGFHKAVRAVAETMASPDQRAEQVNLFPGMLSPADLRYLKEMFADAGRRMILLPDYSDSLDGAAWDEYQLIPPGGTPVSDLRFLGSSALSVQLGRAIKPEQSAARHLLDAHGVPAVELPMPIGAKLTDILWNALESQLGLAMPAKYAQERGRLIDSYVDAHKYLYGLKAVVFGDEDLVAGIAGMLCEVGILPTLCASGGTSGRFAQVIGEIAGSCASRISVRENIDFEKIAEITAEMKPDLLIGSSKGYSLARRLQIPLIRVGFPIHDRFGASRLLHVGYRGAQQLLDRIVNAIQDKRQEESDVGYAYL